VCLPISAERAFATFPGIPLDVFPSGKFIVHRPRVRGGYPTREGIGRTVCWYALFKKFGMRDLLALTEWAGRGLRVGEYSSGSTPDSPVRSSPEDVAALQEAIEAMSSTVSIVIPDTTKLTVLDAPNVNALHEHLVALCNGEMSKAIVGSTLTSEVGEGGGNRALGEVHERVTLMIARGDAEAVAGTLRRDLLRPMVERMFGRGTPVPKITFATDPAQDLTELAKRLDLAARAGVNISQAAARKMLQLPDPLEGDALLVPR
jgi:phage gp29-like protein